jgi:hypothetical protein
MINPTLLNCAISKDKGKGKETCVCADQPPRGMPYTYPLQQQAGLEITDKLWHVILLNVALQMK